MAPFKPRKVVLAGLLLVGVFAGLLRAQPLAGGGAPATPSALTSIAQVREQSEEARRTGLPVRLEGVLTGREPDSGFWVLRAGGESISFRPPPGAALHIGHKVRLTGRTFAALRYPEGSSLTQTLGSFEQPKTLDRPFVARWRGWLLPPITGEYQFWIGSDDGSALYLSDSANPRGKTRIAEVRTWSDPRMWDLTPEQRSKTFQLVAGRAYYIEAVHLNQWEDDNFSVAWRYPGSDRAVVPGRYLAPWEPGLAEAPEPAALHPGGIIREEWSYLHLTGLADLEDHPFVAPGAPVTAISTEDLGLVDPGKPLEIRTGPGLPLGADGGWCELQGSVRFCSTRGTDILLEIEQSGRNVTMWIPNTERHQLQSLVGVKVAARGYAELGRRNVGPSEVVALWASGISDLTVRGSKPVDSLAPVDLGSGDLLHSSTRPVVLRGTAVPGLQAGDTDLRIDRLYKVTGSYSLDAKEWVAMDEQVVPFEPERFGGLYVCSHEAGQRVTAEYSAISGLSATFLDSELGNVIAPGGHEGAGQTFRVTGSGEDVYGAKQQAHFAYQAISPNGGEIVARLDSFGGVRDWAKTGIMLRDGLAPRGRYAMISASAAHGIEYQTFDGGAALSSITATPQRQGSYWLKLAHAPLQMPLTWAAPTARPQRCPGLGQKLAF